MSERALIYRPRVQRVTVQRRLQLMRVQPRGPQGPAGVSGGSRTVTAAADIAAHRIVRVNTDGNVLQADAGTVGDAIGIIGMSTGVTIAGAQCTVRFNGSIQDDTWNWSLGLVFDGVNGAPTQDLTGLTFLRVIGEATAPTRIELNFGQPSYQL